MEVWVGIPEYEGFYEVSSFGRIRSVDRNIIRKDGRTQFCRGRILQSFQGSTCNYLSIQLCRDNIPQKFLIHRLVAIMFCGLDSDSNMEVNHIDGNRHNNRADNLEVVTHQENINHSVRTGLKRDYGENHVHAKLSNEDAKEIRESYQNGVLQKDLASSYGVCKQTISDIIYYKRYAKC